MQDPDQLTPRELADVVDRLGAERWSQDDIAKHFGLTKDKLRYRLMCNGYLWAAETRVRIAATGERLSDVTATSAEEATEAHAA